MGKRSNPGEREGNSRGRGNLEKNANDKCHPKMNQSSKLKPNQYMGKCLKSGGYVWGEGWDFERKCKPNAFKRLHFRNCLVLLSISKASLSKN